ncbi:MAG: hypothetical protein WA005_05100 [Candidatus Binataceae bacterium]
MDQPLQTSGTSLALASGMTAQEVAATCGHSTIAQVIGTYGRFTRGPESAGKVEAFLSGGQTTAGAPES